MIELIKHFLGLCGEHWHPSFITFTASSPVVLYLSTYLYNIKQEIWSKKNPNGIVSKKRMDSV